MWYEDMFTYEGVPMKAPTNAGMKGTQNWRYDREKRKHEPEQEKEEEEPAVLILLYPLTIPLFQNSGIITYS
ncbi:hypothetical protein AMJ87_05270 [candidate division WOR_3 bacterium SM23_60]|uniref:Uncharacterized protein n=1 Tax=candidate division WOR_3 bacterium SM23_60 TaxID=1703780 RepID=A0A0S8GKA3_UNCW3|nr:MAG: hypothetical protein AMJ87_05270 [candidate division WOR_3 bacterium SM23_60]